VSAPATSTARLLAWSVHLYTALGAVAALGALLATVRGDVRVAFLWMAVALAIDSSDGALARRFRVKEVVPEFDGARLDDIVDYLNYVVVPMFFAVEIGLFPAAWAPAIAAAPLLASGYGFAHAGAKTADHFFTGFPSYWNIAVFYMYAIGAAPWANALAIVVLSALVFVPIGYLYPSRQPFLRPLTITLGIAWGAALLIALLRLPAASPTLVWGSFAFLVYYFALSFYLNARRPR
jgi:phosphatidylcholine synthase